MVSCAQIHNDPINQPLLTAVPPSAELGAGVETYYDDTVVALSFSGGGTRAAAFSYGVLTAFDETPTPGRAASLLNRIDFVTGVSGGSVLAAYYGLKKRAALADFKQRFLLRNAEESLQTNLNLLSLAKGLQGGINDPTLFPKWLDDNLYEGATFKTLRYQRRPYIWIMLPISTTARRSSSAPRCLAPCAAISPTIRSRSLSRHRRRCRWRSLPSSFRATREAARCRFPIGCTACAATRTRRRCCGTLPMRCTGITPARSAM
jgi:predicted acylesterase/phospholipase RssA